MTGVDTNVLVRYIMQDDARQAAIATRFIESLADDSPGFLPLVVIIELGWVLSSAYELTRDQLVQALEGVLQTKEFRVEQSDVVSRALRRFKSGGADFADCLIEQSASAAGCERTVTFDKKAAKGCGMELLA